MGNLKAPPDVATALPVLLAAIAALPRVRWPSVLAQFDLLAAHPEMRDDVARELVFLFSLAHSQTPRPQRMTARLYAFPPHRGSAPPKG